MTYGYPDEEPRLPVIFDPPVANDLPGWVRDSLTREVTKKAQPEDSLLTIESHLESQGQEIGILRTYFGRFPDGWTLLSVEGLEALVFLRYWNLMQTFGEDFGKIGEDAINSIRYDYDPATPEEGVQYTSISAWENATGGQYDAQAPVEQHPADCRCQLCDNGRRLRDEIDSGFRAEASMPPLEVKVDFDASDVELLVLGARARPRIRKAVFKKAFDETIEANLQRTREAVEKAIEDTECEECYGTGFYKGCGAPCSKGCKPNE